MFFLKIIGLWLKTERCYLWLILVDQVTYDKITGLNNSRKDLGWIIISENVIFFTLLFFLQEKVKAVFDNLIQLEHLNIVKFHKYWADVKENRARVRDFHPNVSFINLVLTLTDFALFYHFNVDALFFAGYFHYRVHVLRKSQTVFKEDKEKPQDNEWKGTKITSLVTVSPHNIFINLFYFSHVCMTFCWPIFSSCQAWKRWCTQILSALRSVWQSAAHCL